MRNKMGSHAITTTQGHLCSLPIRAIYSQPATAQAAGLSSTRLQCYLPDLNTIGCSAWEASLSNILWSGGCSEWSSSARAALHLCRSRAWSPASHMTCWFLSVCTRDCRILATASWRSSACWKEEKQATWEDTNWEGKQKEALMHNNEKETTISNKYTKCPILKYMCVCVLGVRARMWVKRHFHLFMKKDNKLYEGLPWPLQRKTIQVGMVKLTSPFFTPAEVSQFRSSIYLECTKNFYFCDC